MLLHVQCCRVNGIYSDDIKPSRNEQYKISIFKTPASTFLKRTKQEQQIKHSLQNEL